MAQHDPFREMYERMNEMFRDVTGDEPRTGTHLPIDIEETDQQIIVRADMPGVEKDNISLTIRDNVLHLAADTETAVHEEGKDYVRKERKTKRYSRRIPLPVPVDERTASASYDEGVLAVRIDKVENGTGTDIDIQ